MIADVDRLRAEVASSETAHCSYYLNIRPELALLQACSANVNISFAYRRGSVIITSFQAVNVQAIIEKMRSVSSSLQVATTAVGDLHLQVEAGGVRLATELRSLLFDSSSTATNLLCV